MCTSVFRYWQVKKKCPKCEYQWSDDISTNMFNLRKVSFLFETSSIHGLPPRLI